MPEVSVAIDGKGQVLTVSTASPKSIGTQWQSDAWRPEEAIAKTEFTRPANGFFVAGEEALSVYTSHVPNDSAELDRAYDTGHAHGEGKYYSEMGQSYFLRTTRDALASVEESPDAFLCMLLATAESWKYHYPAFCDVHRWLQKYACPDALQCVKDDLECAMAQREALGRDGDAAAILASLDTKAALPNVNARARDTSLASAPRVLSALLANGQRLPSTLPKDTVPAAMLPAFLFLSGQPPYECNGSSDSESTSPETPH